ncbi:MAG TPA: J domain-containing protein [Chitinophagaceae bacterium]|nr:J domain-containing protein [Chitinophagaceae bacterium]
MTQLKDYYKTLGIPPTASSLQVKKSFRLLALRFHPDKNPGNAAAEASFREVQEAYEVLSDEAKREEYNYKRWYARSLRQPFAHAAVTAAAVMEECRRLARYVNKVSAFRIEYDGLSHHIRQLLSSGNIGLLQQAADKQAPAIVIESLLPATAALPYRYIEPICLLLLQLAADNALLTQKIQVFQRQQEQKYKWQRLLPLLVLLATVLLCWMIYALAK